MIERLARRLPFFYGWVVIAVAFVTMAIGVNARTAFSLLFAPIVDEFGWERATVAGAFSFGFFVSALASPVLGRVMDSRGPRVVVELGVLLMSAGLLLAPFTRTPLHLYLTIGLLVGGGSVCLSFTGQSLYLPNWFVRRRGFAMSVGFSGVGLGSIILLPAFQTWIERYGWRTACVVLGALLFCTLAPLNLLLRKKPADLGLLPDGDNAPAPGALRKRSNVVDAEWAAVDWTLSRALKTRRFWLLALGYFTGLFFWYAVQVHQTKYLVEIGYSPTVAAWALGAVSLAGIPGQIGLGWLSDRIGREWVWTIGSIGFALCYAALLAMKSTPSMPLLYAMFTAQGLLGYGVTAVFGAVAFEIFESRHYGSIFGALSLSSLGGGAAGPFVAGLLHDATGGYDAAFWLSIAMCAVSAAAIWLAAPRKVRAVAGRIKG
ncbi:MAG: MFS transporter [Hyphomicrobiales bacterium]|nr:MFS transporter [Hyphomicrobiales bacterium]